MKEYDAVVVGAGAVGLATAYQLVRAGRTVLVLEKEWTYGTQNSTHGSGVMHTGIYYPIGSWKAYLCVTGYQQLLAFCKHFLVSHRITGKLVVAQDEDEMAVLRQLAGKATNNGVLGVRLIGPDTVAGMEPAVHCVGALHVATTGIIDVPMYLYALGYEIMSRGMGRIQFLAKDIHVHRNQDGFVLHGHVEGSGFEVFTHRLVNAAGLGAYSFAQRIEGYGDGYLPTMRHVKGCIYRYNHTSPFRHLVYPVPSQDGLGIHATLTMSGALQFGPDTTELYPDINFDVPPHPGQEFVDSVKRYYPGFNPDLLRPKHAGVRVKAYQHFEAENDFVIQGPDDHGMEGLVNLFGIESPGLTASLAIGEHVAGVLR